MIPMQFLSSKQQVRLIPPGSGIKLLTNGASAKNIFAYRILD
jgi:hypothetical protein